jgi:predicted nucleic acid-binding protein
MKTTWFCGSFEMCSIWRLRHNLTAYDACYVALAESLGAVLLTGDAGIASLPVHRARIELI